MKYCKDCRYFNPDRRERGIPECIRGRRVIFDENVVFGKSTATARRNCLDMRSIESECGPDAELWEARSVPILVPEPAPEVPPPSPWWRSLLRRKK